MAGRVAEFRDEFGLPPGKGYTEYYGGISNLLSRAAWDMAGIKYDSPMGKKMVEIRNSDVNGFIKGPGKLDEYLFEDEAKKRVKEALSAAESQGIEGADEVWHILRQKLSETNESGSENFRRFVNEQSQKKTRNNADPSRPGR